MASKTFHPRRQAGAATIALTTILAFFVLLPLGLAGFEYLRSQLIHQELTSCTDAAALSGAALLATLDKSDDEEIQDMQQEAKTAALDTFRKNNVLSVPLTSAVEVSSLADSSVSANRSAIAIEFFDPANKNTVVPLGDKRGKGMRVLAVFGNQPAFGRFLGLNSIGIKTRSSAALPKLDLVLCFDISGSMDDETSVSFVKRFYVPPEFSKTTATVYDPSCRIVTTTQKVKSGYNDYKIMASGPLYDALKIIPPFGLAVNALPPQSLQGAGFPDYCAKPIDFSPNLRSKDVDLGSPPGNYVTDEKALSNFLAGTSSTGNSAGNKFTDMVVNVQGYNSIGTLVEAARGNLESSALFASSKASTNTGIELLGSGAKDKYVTDAKKLIMPLKPATDAAIAFVDDVQKNDIRFGLVGFEQAVGRTQRTIAKVSPNYPRGGESEFSIPGVEATLGTGASEIKESLRSMQVIGSTNISGSMRKGLEMLAQTGSAPERGKTLVIFTDGVPSDLDNDANCRQVALECKRQGVSVFTIALAQLGRPAVIDAQNNLLNDWNADPASGGIAAIAGHGGRYFSVSDSSQVLDAFLNVERRLVKLVE